MSKEDLLERLLAILDEKKKLISSTSKYAVVLSASFIEGEKINEERDRRSRQRSLVQARLLLDNTSCQNCGYPELLINEAVRDEILVEVHHVRPLEDGVRKTTVKDLLTLCLIVTK